MLPELTPRRARPDDDRCGRRCLALRASTLARGSASRAASSAVLVGCGPEPDARRSAASATARSRRCAGRGAAARLDGGCRSRIWTVAPTRWRAVGARHRAPTSCISTCRRRRLAWRTAVPVVVVAHSCVADVVARGAAAPPLPADWRVAAAAAPRGLRARRRGRWRRAAAMPTLARSCYGADLPITVVVRNAAAADACRRRTRSRSCLAAGRWWDEGKNGARARRGRGASALAGHRRRSARRPERRSARRLRMPSRSVSCRRRQRCRRCIGRAGDLRRRPRVYEPFGLAVLEAAGAGAALVLADIPTFRELWDDAALFVAADDAAALRRRDRTRWRAMPRLRATARPARPRGARDGSRLTRQARTHGRGLCGQRRRRSATGRGGAAMMRFVLLHPLAGLRLEPRQRAFPARRAARAAGARASTLALEPEDGWSRQNLVADQGAAALDASTATSRSCGRGATAPASTMRRAVDDADVVLVHEWTEPALIARLGRLRRDGGRFTLLFHDTHHRAVSDERAIAGLDAAGLRRRAGLRRGAARALSEARAGAARCSPGTRRPTRGCSSRAAGADQRERPGVDRQLGRWRARRRSCTNS